MSDREYMRYDWEGGPRDRFWTVNPGTKGLLIAMAAIHLFFAVLKAASYPAWREAMNILQLHPEFVLQRFWVWQLVTGGLLHADFMHLLFNGIAIFFFGRLVEQRLGLRRYLLFVLAATIAAAIGYLIWSVLLVSVTPALGASGAAMGLVALAALWYPRMTVLFFGVLPLQLWVLAVLLIFFDLLGALQSGPGGVAHSAHLGGALYGWIYFRHGARFGKLFGAIDRYADRRRREKERRRVVAEAEMRVELDRVLDKVARDGMTALSDRERRFLKDASARLRK